MQIDWFHSFVETIHMKSLSKAGEKLNISQTALSKHIKSLEDSFGVSLFHRSAAGMELTPEGQLLYEKVRQWLIDMDETKRQLMNLASTKRVVLGSLPSLAAHYLPPKILRLKADGVQADIKVFNTSDEIMDNFLGGRIDVAILDRMMSIPKIYPLADLFTEPYYIVLPDSHLLSERSSVLVEDIAQEPFVLYPSKCDVRKGLEHALAQHDVTLNIAGEVPFGEAILGFVAAGAGITIVPEMIAKHLGNKALVAVPILDFGVIRTVSFVAKSIEQFQFLHRYFHPDKRITP